MQEPIYLDEHRFSTAEAVDLSCISYKTLANARMSSRAHVTFGIKGKGRGRYGGELLYSILDVLQLAALHDLTTRVHLAPAEAATVAEMLAGYVKANARRDTQTGRPIADLALIPARMAFVIATIDGESKVQLVAMRTGEYADFAGEWGHAHIVLPITEMLRDLFWKLFACEGVA